MCELNSLHIMLKIDREKNQAEDNEHKNCDAIAQIQQILIDWVPDGPFWSFSGELSSVVAHACPAGGQIARCVWTFSANWSGAILIFHFRKQIWGLHGMN